MVSTLLGTREGIEMAVRRVVGWMDAEGVDTNAGSVDTEGVDTADSGEGG